MDDEDFSLSPNQWQCLAVLEAFGASISMDMTGLLAPILPGEFLELVRLTKQKGWVREPEPRVWGLVSDLPAQLKHRLREINTRQRLSGLVALIEARRLHHQLEPGAWAGLLARAGHGGRAALVEQDLACAALRRGDQDQGGKHLKRILDWLEPELGSAGDR